MSSEKKRLKIGLLTALTLRDPLSSWGITNGYMARALEKHCGEIISIEPMQMRWELLAGKVLNKVAQLLFNKKFLYFHSFFIARRCAKLLSRQLANSDFDLIFAPACASETAFLDIDTPIVIVEDANFVLLHNYYAQFSNLLKRSAREADTLEGMGLNKASLTLFPSEWAARAARENYRVAPENVAAVPFGANVDHPPSREVALGRKRSGRCQLLFLGTDWDRKGGEIAFETLVKLDEVGVQAHLIVCGCVPPPQFTHERMTVIPFLNRKDAQQRKELEQLFETSDFLFLPTRGDAYGMVFCEASSFGLPSIATNTGGVSGAVREGENGFTLPLTARGAEYAALIAAVYQDEARYDRLVKSSRAAYENILNWDVWGRTVTALLDGMLERRKALCEGEIAPETVSVFKM